MKSRWINYGFVATAALVLSVAAIGGQQPKAKTVKGGESGLVGIKLYDSGTRVISIYGNPTEILPVSFGGGTIGPGGGGGAGGGRPGGPGAPMGGGPGLGGPGSASASHGPGDGFGFGTQILMQGGKMGPGGASSDLGAPGQGGGDADGGMPRSPGMGPGGGGMGGGSGSKLLYTRWVYKRGPSKYGFIMDKFNRVVQCEAIGMNDGRVRTSKGIKFGSTFGEVIKRYQTPDGYEINGDNIVVRYLVRNKVAFRLSRLGEKKPHVVTGIVVAGGKT